MIVDMLSNKKINPVVTELFIRGKKLNISLVFITQFYFAVPKNIRIISKQYFVMNIPNKRELPKMAFNQSFIINFQDFMNLYKNCTAKPYSFWWLILFLHQIIVMFQTESFRENIKTSHDNWW